MSGQLERERGHMTGWFRQLTAEALLETAILLAFGYLLADSLGARRRWNTGIALALAFPTLVAFSLILMLGHIATGGAVFSRPWVVRGITAAVAVIVVVRKIASRGSSRAGRPRDWLPIIGMVVLALVVWGYPVARIVPLASGGDIRWHLGWASQILNGETTPNSILTGSVPNYYPWMFHAVVAFLAAFTPGGQGYHVLAPIHLLQVSAVVLALFALGKEVGKTNLAGAGVALFGAVAAGPLLQSTSVLTHPADLGARGTYNASLYNIAPPLPRDMAYALLVGFLLLLVLALQERSRALFLTAGVLLGLVGLTTWEAFFVGVGTTIVLSLLPGPVPRVSRALNVLVPALGVYAIWAAPLAVAYVRLGGFTNTTAGPPPILSPVAVLLSWGLVTPFAVYAAARWVPSRRAEPALQVGFALLIASAAFVMASSIIPRFLGGSFETLGRAARYWPNLYLAVAILAGVGAAELIRLVAGVRVGLAAAAGGVIVAMAVAVPLGVSIGIPQRWRAKPVLAATMLGRHNLITNVASTGRADCVVASPRYIQMTIFSYAGYRQVAYRGADAHFGNYSRIRWRNIFDRMPADEERLTDNDILIEGRGPVRQWQQLARKYGVDMLVVRRQHVDKPVFRKLFPGQVARLSRQRDPMALFRIGACNPS